METLKIKVNIAENNVSYSDEEFSNTLQEAGLSHTDLTDCEEITEFFEERFEEKYDKVEVDIISVLEIGYKIQETNDNPSVYVYSDFPITEEQAENYLEENDYDVWENYYFVEFDQAVASHLGFNFCAVFHKE